MERVIQLSAGDLVKERFESAVQDVHFPQALVRTVLAELTAPGDLVLGPFAVLWHHAHRLRADAAERGRSRIAR